MEKNTVRYIVAELPKMKDKENNLECVAREKFITFRGITV